jgi:hypothetical protein
VDRFDFDLSAQNFRRWCLKGQPDLPFRALGLQAMRVSMSGLRALDR